MTLESSWKPRDLNIRQVGVGEGKEGNENMAVFTSMAIGAGVSAFSAWRAQRAQDRATDAQSQANSEALADARATERFNRRMHAQEEARLMPLRQYSMNMLMGGAPEFFEGEVFKAQAPTRAAYDPNLALQEDPEETRRAILREHPNFGANDHLSDGRSVRGYAPPDAPGPQASQYLQEQDIPPGGRQPNAYEGHPSVWTPTQRADRAAERASEDARQAKGQREVAEREAIFTRQEANDAARLARRRPGTMGGFMGGLA